MTACTNHGGKARRVVTAALVGVLSVGTVPMVALATGANDGISLMATDQEVWQNSTFEFDHEANADGTYTVSQGDTLSLVRGTDPSGNSIDLADVTVAFFESGSASLNAGTVDPTSTIVDSVDSLSGRPGEMPSAAGKYWVVVFDGDVTLRDSTRVRDYGTNYKGYLVNVVADTTSVSDAQAFEYVDQNGDGKADSVSDTEFNYSGGALKVAFQVGGKQLESSNCNVVWTKTAGAVNDANWAADGYFTVTEAGTYTARITGNGAFSGTADVTFEVEGIDLNIASVSIAPVDAATGIVMSGNYLDNEGLITVNGVKLVDNDVDLTAELIAVNDVAPSGVSSPMTANGKYTFKVTPKPNQSNVTGEAIVDAYIVNTPVDYYYNGVALTNGGTVLSADFDANKGLVFTTAALSAKAGAKDVAFTATVTKDGVEVSSFDEPGTYKLVLDTPVTTNLAGAYDYAGHCEVTFTVAGADYTGSVVYASYDGKNLDGTTPIEYTGEAIEPLVVVRDKDNKVLTEGEDYSVKFTDAKGNDVESATEVGSYEIVVTFNGKYNPATDNTETISLVIDKALIESAKATADFFGIPEDGAATPTFVGSTDVVFEKGNQFDLSSDQISVRYYEANGTAGSYTKGASVKAEDLTEPGVYIANINILSSTKNIEGTNIDAVFELSKTAVFADVDANEWYAQVVAQAYKNAYVNGIAGTNLFAPKAQITRADVACILFNMAGGNVTDTGTVVGNDEFGFNEIDGYITGFDDVDGHAYYAKAIAWAHASGVVNGYNGEFRPNDKITREEFAAMLANFAKSKGDFEAPSADALDGMPDASGVSSWATESVAWAVENCVMGNGGYVKAQDNIIRAEVAAMAVNYQPEPLVEITSR